MLPWVKVDHITYRHSEFRAKASMQARYAYHELVTIAPLQTPALSIPNDDEVIAGWLNVSVKQWLKVRDLVLSQFTQGDDGRFYCDMLVELYSNQHEVKQDDRQQDNNQDNDKPLTNAERCKRYRNNRNNTNDMSTDMSTDTTADTGNMSTDTTATRDRHNEKVSQHESNMSKRVEMGGRGEDLDSELKQDLELKQEVNTTTKVVGAPHTSERVKNKKSQSNFSANEMILSCETLSTEVANDFINYRKAKKAPLTSSAWKTMVSEIQHSGMTPDNALSETMSAGWVGVKAEWLINRNAKQSPNVIPMSSRPKLPSQMTEDERQELRRKNAAEAKKILFGDDDFIDGVASHV